MLEVGQIVKSKAGHDKGDFQVVTEIDPPYLILCDGKRRSLENPKRKKEMHISPTNTVVDPNQLKTNRQIRAAIRAFLGG